MTRNHRSMPDRQNNVANTVTARRDAGIGWGIVITLGVVTLIIVAAIWVALAGVGVTPGNPDAVGPSTIDFQPNPGVGGGQGAVPQPPAGEVPGLPAPGGQGAAP